MNLKWTIVFFAIFTIKTSVSAKSFNLVIDTTSSMRDEMDVIIRNMRLIANDIKSAPDLSIFGVVTFDHNGVVSSALWDCIDMLLNEMSRFTLSEGHDCPENSLAGILKGVEESSADSSVYVFTDASANDDSKFYDIEALCKRKRIQVVIFLSGSCPDPRQPGNVEVYYRIAKSCSGAVFRHDHVSLKKGFRYIQEMVNSEWNDIATQETFVGSKSFTINADTFTKDMLVAVSGDQVSLEIRSDKGDIAQTEMIVDSRHTRVVRILDIKVGVYQIFFWSQHVNSLTFYKREEVPFQWGFSIKQPRILKETSERPMPGKVNYIIIVPLYEIEVISLKIQMTDGREKVLTLSQIESQKRIYVSNVFIENEQSFRCVIKGRDTKTYREVIGATKYIDVQRQVSVNLAKPSMEIFHIDHSPVQYETRTSVACKVKGHPKPIIEWEISPEAMITTEEYFLELPSTYINYANFMVKTNSTCKCKARNTEGESLQTLDVIVHRPSTFEVIQTPQDATFEYGTEGRLNCKVEAWPEVEIKWYHNDTLVSSFGNFEIIPDQFALVIKSVGLDDAGSYRCEVQNYERKENFYAEVTVSGLEAPEVGLDNSEIILLPGDFKEIKCSILIGNPTPQISWSYKAIDSSYFSQSMPDDVEVNEDTLKIQGKLEHKGTYKCTGSNMMGSHSQEVSVTMHYAPIVTNSDVTSVEVEVGNPVELKCEVDAIPKATVRWEMTKDDVIITFDDKHVTDESNTHRFTARYTDSGNYHCIAENYIGRSEKTVNVNVLVSPYIKPEVDQIEARAGTSVTLPCLVTRGNPPPTTMWQFISTESKASILSRGNSSSFNLRLDRVSRANEGAYLCIADNSVGNDYIRMRLKVI